MYHIQSRAASESQVEKWAYAHQPHMTTQLSPRLVVFFACCICAARSTSPSSITPGARWVGRPGRLLMSFRLGLCEITRREKDVNKNAGNSLMHGGNDVERRNGMVTRHPRLANGSIMHSDEGRRKERARRKRVEQRQPHQITSGLQ